ncbi:MAG: DUF1428 domain-containing protein [Devosia sp.]|jgi:uncharacterized protein YbaA (DUF1428 family)|uniref:DUF1428 domain-containing protein n=1 Tax=unclassified Devosia TaxID=196773 RepID=UPI0019E7E691|nr:MULTISPECIES: DUF1428 domain-containing protein [unclassified Devosia]MBF0679587.1 DUF1428 domain-containing protein [Devosia sp.]WEJ33231.1 DUF1428 domain-containing protein [Devosia sp. SD17-2]
MTYVDGFVAAVPRANKELYIAHARAAAELFLKWGALRVVENWGDDVPTGEHTDFQRAVGAKDDEVIVFSWIEYPDKATRDIIQKRMMEGPEMANFPALPFDGQRMIFGGFTTLMALD